MAGHWPPSMSGLPSPAHPPTPLPPALGCKCTLRWRPLVTDAREIGPCRGQGQQTGQRGWDGLGRPQPESEGGWGGLHVVLSGDRRPDLQVMATTTWEAGGPREGTSVGQTALSHDLWQEAQARIQHSTFLVGAGGGSTEHHCLRGRGQ